jgi:hypothetical protein
MIHKIRQPPVIAFDRILKTFRTILPRTGNWLEGTPGVFMLLPGQMQFFFEFETRRAKHGRFLSGLSPVRSFSDVDRR